MVSVPFAGRTRSGGSALTVIRPPTVEPTSWSISPLLRRSTSTTETEARPSAVAHRSRPPRVRRYSSSESRGAGGVGAGGGGAGAGATTSTRPIVTRTGSGAGAAARAAAHRGREPRATDRAGVTSARSSRSGARSRVRGPTATAATGSACAGPSSASTVLAVSTASGASGASASAVGAAARRRNERREALCVVGARRVDGRRDRLPGAAGLASSVRGADGRAVGKVLRRRPVSASGARSLAHGSRVGSTGDSPTARVSSASTGAARPVPRPRRARPIHRGAGGGEASGRGDAADGSGGRRRPRSPARPRRGRSPARTRDRTSGSITGARPSARSAMRVKKSAPVRALTTAPAPGTRGGGGG